MLIKRVLTSILILAFVLSGCTSPEAAPPRPDVSLPTDKMVIGYYPSWATARGVPLLSAPTQKLVILTNCWN